MSDLTPADIAEIRSRHEEALRLFSENGSLGTGAMQDRGVLLAEVDRLKSELKVSLGPGLYLDIQKVLDKALGTEEADGAGAGIVADITLVVERMQAAEAEAKRLNAAVNLLGGQLQGGAQATKDLARVIDVVALEIRRAVRLANAGDPAAAMQVITDFAADADWLDDLDADDTFDRPSAPTAEQEVQP